MSEDLRKVSLPVSGMTCAACARWVEKALSGTVGVRAANVNLAAVIGGGEGYGGIQSGTRGSRGSRGFRWR